MSQALDRGALRRQRNTVQREPNIHGRQEVEELLVAAGVERGIVEVAQKHHVPTVVEY